MKEGGGKINERMKERTEVEKSRKEGQREEIKERKKRKSKK